MRMTHPPPFELCNEPCTQTRKERWDPDSNACVLFFAGGWDEKLASPAFGKRLNYRYA